MGEYPSKDLYAMHRSIQDKYTSFLLAITASAIAFSIQKTDSLKISWSLIPIGFAVLFWCVSFYCGCKNLIWVQVTLYANYALVQLSEGNHPDQPANPAMSQAAKEGAANAMVENASRARFYSIFQYRFLIAGAILFLIWHILEMLLRTYG